MPPYVIFHDATLKEMAAYFPRTEADFLAINGVGQARYDHYGEVFIQEIKRFAENNPIEIRTRPELEMSYTESSPIKKRIDPNTEEKATPDKDSKIPSCDITYDLFMQGQTIAEIAVQRELTENTVLGHLFRCDQEEKPVDWSGFVDQEKEIQIINAIGTVGLEGLKPIKEALSADCSYEDIKIVIHKNGLR
ncbi:MAG: helix-turn-helix domain-containing protein [Acetobacterium sp.]|nr:helix-turn-helix domain-containing protein [Acetobacterium sp.]